MPVALDADCDAVVCCIRNKSELSRLWVSEALLDEVRTDPKLSVASKTGPMAFDQDGNLLPEDGYAGKERDRTEKHQLAG